MFTSIQFRTTAPLVSSAFLIYTFPSLAALMVTSALAALFASQSLVINIFFIVCTAFSTLVWICKFADINPMRTRLNAIIMKFFILLCRNINCGLLIIVLLC